MVHIGKDIIHKLVVAIQCIFKEDSDPKLNMQDTFTIVLLAPNEMHMTRTAV